MPFDINQFYEAITLGNYIDAVEQTLAAGPADPKEELRDRLFRQRLFESALRQAASDVEFYDWFVAKQQSTFPPAWWIKHDTLGVDTPEYYTHYRLRFIKAQLFCAFQVAQLQVPDITHLNANLMRSKAKQFGFSLGFLYDCAQIFCTNALMPLESIHSVKVPVLLVVGGNGAAAYLHLEQVNLDIESEPYPHPIEMSVIPIDKTFNDSVVNAFRYFKTRWQAKTFRWWLEPIDPPELNGVQGPSVYGAFMLGMYSAVHNKNWHADSVVTCGGDQQGQLFGINGLAKKCEAAIKQGWNRVIVSSKQDYQGDNALTQELLEKLSIVEVDHVF